jgi:hypothetical protein
MKSNDQPKRDEIPANQSQAISTVPKTSVAVAVVKIEPSTEQVVYSEIE